MTGSVSGGVIVITPSSSTLPITSSEDKPPADTIPDWVEAITYTSSVVPAPVIS